MTLLTNNMGDEISKQLQRLLPGCVFGWRSFSFVVFQPGNLSVCLMDRSQISANWLRRWRGGGSEVRLTSAWNDHLCQHDWDKDHVWYLGFLIRTDEMTTQRRTNANTCVSSRLANVSGLPQILCVSYCYSFTKAIGSIPSTCRVPEQDSELINKPKLLEPPDEWGRIWQMVFIF